MALFSPGGASPFVRKHEANQPEEEDLEELDDIDLRPTVLQQPL
jgi:hypothetical protein